ncbi:MAG: glutamate racemase, partial [Gramella sp.]|nr:glutamate racemase [Christiangramia sp.]
PALRKILPENVMIIDSGEAVARQTKSILLNESLLNTSEENVQPEFYTNTTTEVLEEIINARHKGYKVSTLNF